MATAAATFTKTGTKATASVKLNPDVFAVEVKNHQLLKDAYLSYLANGRPNSAKTKKRGEISGGGAKPWRQKGTGRARVGSSRNPLWRGGGVAFGPTGNENFSRNLTLKARQLALRQALTLAATEGRIRIIEDFVTGGTTKSAVSLLQKINAGNNNLVVVDSKTPELIRSLNNLASAKLVQSNYLNTYEVMNADAVVITKKALDLLDQRLGGKNA